MKKVLLLGFSIAMAFGASAAPVAKQLPALKSQKSVKKDVANLSMSHMLTALYDDRNYKVPNYYLIFASDPNAKYNANTGAISAPANSFTFIIDCYNFCPDGENYLPEGTYMMMDSSDEEHPFGYSKDYSMLNYYDENQQQNSFLLTNPVEVTRAANGRYTVSTLVDLGDDVINVTYTGPISIGSSTEKPTVYPQITHDIVGNLDKGGISFYQGVPDGTSQGVSYLDLYDVDFNRENGYMNAPGLNLSMMITHKRFTKRELYAVCPGTYTNSMSLKRDTWYPAREIDYMGFVMPFGSYLRELKIENGERNYTYAYLKEGEFTIEDNGDGTYKGRLTATTTLGYNVDVTWSGKITLNTDNATFKATVSDLVDDVDLDFSKLDKGRIYHTGIMGGCRTLVVDLGSPSGKDEAIQYGGDLLRMEFLVDPKYSKLQPGLYTVVPRRWNSNELTAGGTYEPWSLNKGYFDGNGAQIGTRYAHFEEGRYCVYDMVGPAEEGTVRVETDDYQNYTFHIDIMDDAGFKIAGLWDNKPIEYCYDPNAIDGHGGVKEIGDNESVKAVLEGSNIILLNAGNEPVAVYAADGKLLYSGTADEVIPVSALGTGMFIINTPKSSIKVTL